MQLSLAPPLLVARFPRPQRVLSWAVVGGGLRECDAVAWLEVRDAELGPDVDAALLARARLEERGLSKAVGLITSRCLALYEDVERHAAGAAARAVVTVGLGNALRAGDLPTAGHRVGTINVLCAVDAALSDEALIEALALVSEAKALAVREASFPSPVSGLPASGTGTDCLVVACPAGKSPPTRFAGKHTALGHVIGASVHEAVARGARAWLAEHAS